MHLSPQLILAGYAQGVFPMTDRHGEINFYTADPRAIIPLDTFVVGRRLARTVRNGNWNIRVDTAFADVIAACAHPSREGSWIGPEIIRAYTELHALGYAHSVETWRDGELVGGLYGVALGGLFAGESMFSHARDASKVALVHLVERLCAGGFTLLDTQYLTGDHMRQFGATEIPLREYRRRLAHALAVQAHFS